MPTSATSSVSVPTKASRRTLVVIPTYNEIENLSIIVDRTLRAVPSVDVLVVDDSSPDGTGRLADDLSRTDARVHVLHRTSKDGLGAAYLAGFAWALERAYTAVVEMDADGSHQPEQLPRLLAALEWSDLVIGSRWVSGGSVENWPRRREILSRGGNAYARLMLGTDVRDATGGFRAFRAETLLRLGLDDVDSQGYCFQVDLARRTLQAGLTVTEVPIRFVERVRGTSKMSGAIVREAMWRVTVWGLESRSAQRRLPVERPAAERTAA
jgi:dolichol-phosphate mannosyltransferase